MSDDISDPTSCGPSSLAPLGVSIVPRAVKRFTNPTGQWYPAPLWVLEPGTRLQPVNVHDHLVEVIMDFRRVALTWANGLVSQVSQHFYKVPITRDELKRLKTGVTPVTATQRDRVNGYETDTTGRCS